MLPYLQFFSWLNYEILDLNVETARKEFQKVSKDRCDKLYLGPEQINS